MNKKEQTALRFFLIGLIELEIGKGIPTSKEEELHLLYDKAKQMEEDQLFEFWNGGINSTDEGGKSFDQFYEIYNK
jgi:hypothetical protein